MRCSDCARLLTAEEQHYYEFRCERCERAWSDRVDAWMAGGEDRGLDDAFDSQDREKFFQPAKVH